MSPEEVAAGLSEARRIREDLTDNWDAFCDADQLPHPRDYPFPDNLEASGYATLESVDDDDLETPFAWERGIVAGGLVWRLTPLGEQVRHHRQKGQP